MKIEREDVNRMKELAQKLAGIGKNPVAIRRLEHGFVDDMTAKYGRPAAITMLTKVWKMTAMLRVQPDPDGLEEA